MRPNYESIKPRTQTINELLEHIKRDLSKKKPAIYLKTGPYDTVYIGGLPYRSAPA